MQLQPTKYFAKLSVVVQEYFIVYCRSTYVVKLLRFLLTPYSLMGTCNSVHNCIFRGSTGIFYGLFYALRAEITQSV
jgi:hypothetical protein